MALEENILTSFQAQYTFYVPESNAETSHFQFPFQSFMFFPNNSTTKVSQGFMQIEQKSISCYRSNLGLVCVQELVVLCIAATQGLFAES